MSTGDSRANQVTKPSSRELRLAVTLLCAVAVLATAACGSHATSWRVRYDGRIGPLKIDASTESDVRDFAGRPLKVEKVFSEAKKHPVGYELDYRCGRSCVTSYAISYTTGKLSDFTTESPRFVSEHGSRVGMSAKRAAEAEGRRIIEACGEGHVIQLRSDEHHIFVLGVFAGRVSVIVYLGPHTTSYEGLC